LSQTSVNSDNKGRQLDSDFKIKTSLEAVQDFSVNPFKDYENYNEKEVIEDQEQNLGLIKSKIKEAKVPHLFQTRPLKEAMEQVNKFTELHNEAKARLHEKQMEMVSEELKTLRSKPEISKYSRQIMQNKKYVPLYKRTDEILSKKEAKLTEERKKMEEQKDAMEKKGLTFRPELHKKPETFKTFEEFEETMKNWNRAKQEKIAKKQFLNLEKEVENHPFKPEINEKSKKILLKKGYSLERKVENRLLESNEKEKSRKLQEMEKNRPQFKPQLNQKTDKIVKERKNKANYLVEFLQSPEKAEKLNIQITTQGVEVYFKESTQ